MFNKDNKYSIFTVNDYKGGKLTSEIMISFDDMIDSLINNGIIAHEEVPYWDVIFDKSEEDIIRICNEADINYDIYAGVSSGPYCKGWTGELYEHTENGLSNISVADMKQLLPIMAQHIIKDL